MGTPTPDFSCPCLPSLSSVQLCVDSPGPLCKFLLKGRGDGWWGRDGGGRGAAPNVALEPWCLNDSFSMKLPQYLLSQSFSSSEFLYHLTLTFFLQSQTVDFRKGTLHSPPPGSCLLKSPCPRRAEILREGCCLFRSSSPFPNGNFSLLDPGLIFFKI